MLRKQDGLAKPIVMSGYNAQAQSGSQARRDSTNDMPEMPEQDPYGLDEVLDDDGEPYFQPLDLERVFKKYADLGLDPREVSKLTDSDEEALPNH